MGQASLPVLNKVGYSMYWQDSWASSFSYTKLFNLKKFFLKFFKFFFEDFFHLSLYQLNRCQKDFFISEQFTFWTGFYRHPTLFIATEGIYKKIFLGKLWFLVNKNITVVAIYIYIPFTVKEHLYGKKDLITFKNLNLFSDNLLNLFFVFNKTILVKKSLNLDF